MTTYQIDVEKQLGEEFWTNVYHVDASSMSDAQVQAGWIVAVEKPLHNTAITITKFRAAPYPGPAEGSIVAVNEGCTGGAGNMLPLFNVVRVDFPAPIGRPSRKYYRSGLTDAEVENGELPDGTRDGYQAVVDEFFTGDSPNLVDVDGQPLSTASVFKKIGMRQLRRGSKRPVV